MDAEGFSGEGLSCEMGEVLCEVFHEFFCGCFDGFFVSIFVFGEPVAVVVFFELFEEGGCFFWEAFEGHWYVLGIVIVFQVYHRGSGELFRRVFFGVFDS